MAGRAPTGEDGGSRNLLVGLRSGFSLDPEARGVYEPDMNRITEIAHVPAEVEATDDEGGYCEIIEPARACIESFMRIVDFHHGLFVNGQGRSLVLYRRHR
jgi:hypothetical protein